MEANIFKFLLCIVIAVIFIACIEAKHSTDWRRKDLIVRTIDSLDSINDLNICGRPLVRPNVFPRIVAGDEAVPNSWPWTASMRYGEWQSHGCAASVINDRWLVTAAHCPIEPDTVIVLGAHYEDPRLTKYQKTVRIAYTVGHELYGRLPVESEPGLRGATHDIRLVQLASAVKFNAGVQPVCLPRQNQTFPAGKYCYTSGWGNMKYGSSPPENLQQLRLPLHDVEECNETRWYNGSLDDSLVCAGYTEGGKGSCHGDSGGPLVCLDDNRWVLVGVVSWGKECAAETHPALYAKVSVFIDWIQQKIALREAAEAGILPA